MYSLEDAADRRIGERAALVLADTLAVERAVGAPRGGGGLDRTLGNALGHEVGARTLAPVA